MTASQPFAHGPSQVDAHAADLTRIARHMYALMLRNIASDGYPFRDPAGNLSKPGCVIAAPSWMGNTPGIDQDYIFHWVRDAAVTMMEVAAVAKDDPDEIEPLVDYVAFSKTCQDNTTPDKFARAAFIIDGRMRCWTNQNDGPAIQTLAMLGFFELLPDASKAVARDIMQRNVDFVAAHYRDPTRDLWEEKDGPSFFASSVQLACLRAIKANAAGVTAPANIDTAIADIEAALASHWNESDGYYVSMLPLTPPIPEGKVLVEPGDERDVNIDIVCAAIYGAVPVTDTRLLASAAKLRAQWTDAGAKYRFAINDADKALGLGPLLGRYPGDFYDGDVAHPVRGGHPWALCTANLAELYYRVANATARDGRLPLDDLSRPFFAQIGVADGADPTAAGDALRAAGDAMLRALVFHSDHLELSEQFDGATGFEKSVRNLTWSYASFLSAVRARAGGIV